jgi:glycosyltransferase involved in cell wall biosynthesis
VRVLVLTTSYPSPGDPVRGIFVREYARAVAPWCDVCVVHLDRAHDVRGIELERREEEPPVVRVRYPYRPTALSIARHFEAARRGLRAAPFRPDVIHAHFFLAAGPAVLLGRAPVVATEHWSVFLPEDPATLSPPMRRAARLALARAAAVTVPSEALARALPVPALVVPNVVDTELFHPDGEHEPLRLLSAGLFYEAKALDLLIDAVARVPDVRLDLVGDGDSRPELERLARRLGADVTFHGILPKPELAELMRRADLYVSASRYENNPVSLLEALASGLPLVATAVGGVPEIVGDDGLLAPPGEPAALAERIEQALRIDFDRDDLARRAAERYGAGPIGRGLVDLYAQVTRPRARTARPR